jgi:hypothetical protein
MGKPEFHLESIWHIKGKTAAGIALVIQVTAASAHEALQIAAATLNNATVIF